MASRDIKAFVKDIIRKSPRPFPYIAVFHLLACVVMLLVNWGDKITDYYVEILWLIGFTVSWLYVCDARKWAAVSYIVLTVANVATYLYFEYTIEYDFIRIGMQAKYVSALWLPAFLFSFLVLFYFKKMKSADTENTSFTDASKLR